MGHKEKNANRIMAFLCICLTVVVFFTILLRVFTRQVLVERLGISNGITSAVFWDSASLESAQTSSSKESSSWRLMYPFSETGEVENDVESIYLERNVGNVISLQVFDKALNAYVGLVDSVKEKIETYSTDYLMGHDMAAQGAVSLDKSILWENPINPGDFSRIIEMENGYLTYVQPRVEDDAITDIAESVSDFAGFLEEKGIPFIYMNAGSKVSPADMELSDYEKQYEHTNENGDRLVNEIKSRGVYTVDFRKLMIESDLDWYASYYKTDHHWTNETQLWAAGVLSNFINEKTGSNFDRSIFEIEKYKVKEYESYMFGGQGRAKTLKGADLESYKLILPDFETNLKLTIWENGQVYEGPYEASLFDMEAFERIADYSGTDYLSQKDPYNCIRIDNYPLATIENLEKNNNEDLKILFIEDSFNWYIASYLALDAGHIDIIYPIAFDGSIRNYVEYSNPDIVILSSCEKAINPIDYSNHASYFDLR